MMEDEKKTKNETESVYEPVVFRKTEGRLVLFDDRIEFHPTTSATSDTVLPFSLIAKHFKNPVKQPKALLRVTLKNDDKATNTTSSMIFQLINREELDRASKEVKVRLQKFSSPTMKALAAREEDHGTTKIAGSSSSPVAGTAITNTTYNNVQYKGSMGKLILDSSSSNMCYMVEGRGGQQQQQSCWDWKTIDKCQKKENKLRFKVTTTDDKPILLTLVDSNTTNKLWKDIMNCKRKVKQHKKDDTITEKAGIISRKEEEDEEEVLVKTTGKAGNGNLAPTKNSMDKTPPPGSTAPPQQASAAAAPPNNNKSTAEQLADLDKVRYLLSEEDYQIYRQGIVGNTTGKAGGSGSSGSRPPTKNSMEKTPPPASTAPPPQTPAAAAPNNNNNNKSTSEQLADLEKVRYLLSDEDYQINRQIIVANHHRQESSTFPTNNKKGQVQQTTQQQERAARAADTSNDNSPVVDFVDDKDIESSPSSGENEGFQQHDNNVNSDRCGECYPYKDAYFVGAQIVSILAWLFSLTAFTFWIGLIAFLILQVSCCYRMPGIALQVALFFAVCAGLVDFILGVVVLVQASKLDDTHAVAYYQDNQQSVQMSMSVGGLSPAYNVMGALLLIGSFLWFLCSGCLFHFIASRMNKFESDYQERGNTVVNNNAATASAPAGASAGTTTSAPASASSTHDKASSTRRNNNNDNCYIIGGSVAATAVCVCCICCILPLIVFLIVWFTVVKQANDVANSVHSSFGTNSWNDDDLQPLATYYDDDPRPSSSSSSSSGSSNYYSSASSGYITQESFPGGGSPGTTYYDSNGNAYPSQSSFGSNTNSNSGSLSQSSLPGGGSSSFTSTNGDVTVTTTYGSGSPFGF